MNNTEQPWVENVIVADAAFLDRTAFDLTVNFERMIGRRIPPADFCRWAECVALDGGVRGQGNAVQVVLAADGATGWDNFAPAAFADIDQKAFQAPLGEFAVNVARAEDMAQADDFFLDLVQTAVAHKDVRRVMIVPDDRRPGLTDQLRHLLRDTPDDKRITVFAMQPTTGGNFRQEILGYSLMSALGIRADELK